MANQVTITFTSNQVLNLRLALGGETRRWRELSGMARNAGDDRKADTMTRVADEYSALWGMVQSAQDHADYDPDIFEGDDLTGDVAALRDERLAWFAPHCSNALALPEPALPEPAPWRALPNGGLPPEC